MLCVCIWVRAKRFLDCDPCIRRRFPSPTGFATKCWTRTRSVACDKCTASRTTPFNLSKKSSQPISTRRLKSSAPAISTENIPPKASISIHELRALADDISLSLSLSRMRTHALSLSLLLFLSFSLFLSLSLSFSCSLSHTLSRSLLHSLTLSRSLSLSHSHLCAVLLQAKTVL